AEATAYALTPTVTPTSPPRPTPTPIEIPLQGISDTLLLPSDFERYGEYGWERVGVEPLTEVLSGAGAWICNVDVPTRRFVYGGSITQVFEIEYRRTLVIQSIAGQPGSSEEEAALAIADARQAFAHQSWTDAAGQTWIVTPMDVPVVNGDELFAFNVRNADAPETKPRVAVIVVRQGPVAT
ncbi:MAG: hypothetical protein ACRD1H_09305, partial [Vicinamibacterales bacterium]